MEIDGGPDGREEVRGATATAAVPTTPVFGHAPFSGTYRTRVEANGRLALPSAFKYAFADAALVRAQRREHLRLWTPLGFEEMAKALLQAKRPDAVLDPQSRLRLFKSAPRVSVDRQSRLVIPPELREQVGIGGETPIVLAGAVEFIELWPADRFDEVEAERMDELDLLFDTYDGLPTDPA